MAFKFIPNSVAQELLGTTKSNYTGDGMTPLLEEAIGKEKYDRYILAQDPLCGGKTEGDIKIILNPGECDPNKMQYASIGKIQLVP